MQSRAIAGTASKVGSLFSAIRRTETPLWVRAAKSISRIADQSIHAEYPDDVEREEARKSALAEEEQSKNRDQKPQNEQLRPTTPIASSPSLKSTESGRSGDPLSGQQRRHYSSISSSSDGLDQVSCVGIDGSPVPKQSGRSAEEENREYFKDHKASPLSNIEMADTRKPITRATDSVSTVSFEGLAGEKMAFAVVMESAEETFDRASRIWRETAMRSWIRDAPHTKVLVSALGDREEAISDLVECPITA